MFNWFRRKRKAVIPVTTAIFLTGLFVFYCPYCLARMAREMTGMNMEHHAAGHCSLIKGNKALSTGPHKHCNGTCDCAANAKIFASGHALATHDVKASPHTRIAIQANLARLLPVMTYLTYIVGRPYKPDRACYPPLERICVLLN